MSLFTVLEQLHINTTGLTDFAVAGISANSRDIKDNFIFAAIKGGKTDGAQFIPQAIENGALLIVAECAVSASVPVLVVENAREVLAQLAHKIYSNDFVDKLAITGTNGKTSTAYFVAQLLNNLAVPAASIGTIGVHSEVYNQSLPCTTPDSTHLNQILQKLQENKIKAAIMETSSHGLDQKRVSGITFKVAGFTNLTQDHLDYHHNMDLYLKAKMNLFTNHMDNTGTAVLNADIPEFETIKKVCEEKGILVYDYGKNATFLKLISVNPTITGQHIVVHVAGVEHTFDLSIFGDFQVSNILCAVGMVYAYGQDMKDILPLLPYLKAPVGRMEKMGVYNNAPIFVDYAHTPDALMRVLTSLRQHTNKRLKCIFGCGGNRDTTKRAIMGKIANDLADEAYITDDNPRFENAETIRQMVKSACANGIEIGDRAMAIHTAISSLESDDILVICGKGHETGQIVGDTTYILNDGIEVKLAINTAENRVLYTSNELKLVFNTEISPLINATGVAINTKTMQLGDLFFAIGQNMDTAHFYAVEAIKKGATAVVVEKRLDTVPLYRQIVVENTQIALEKLAQFARLRSPAQFVGITGSAGKTTTKEMLKSALCNQGNIWATRGNLNNHIGVPLTIAQMPQNTDFALIEMGMNHTGEMAALSALVRPNVVVITMIGQAHQAFFANVADIAAAKAEIFTHLSDKANVVLNKDDAFYSYLSTAAVQHGAKKIISYGKNENASIQLQKCLVQSGGTDIDVRYNGADYHFTIGFTGVHFAYNALAVLGVVEALGASVDYAIQHLKNATPTMGRGATFRAKVGEKAVLVIDDAYNANPASMKASIISLSHYTGGRRIAILGDMLELGEKAPDFHLELAAILQENKIDKVYAIGNLMQYLYHALPPEMQGGAGDKLSDMMDNILNQVQDNDTILIKSSNSMGLSLMVDKLRECAI